MAIQVSSISHSPLIPSPVDPSASTLRDLITRHGGRYQAYYSRSAVTHVIASRLPYGKINRLSDEKIVTANWITER
ncbi:unnamed protein product [Trichobilharzia regenti]|nr:unnamed protein product [Trichobilharzia regenti]